MGPLGCRAIHDRDLERFHSHPRIVLPPFFSCQSPRQPVFVPVAKELLWASVFSDLENRRDARGPFSGIFENRVAPVVQMDSGGGRTRQDHVLRLGRSMMVLGSQVADRLPMRWGLLLLGAVGWRSLSRWPDFSRYCDCRLLWLRRNHTRQDDLVNPLASC